MKTFENRTSLPTSGLFGRFLTTVRHLLGLLLGATSSWAGQQKRSTAWVGKALGLFVNPTLRAQPFSFQLRKRLEFLGPTYIKLGQILSLREDLLPKSITEELKNLLDECAVIPFEYFTELVENDLKKPIDQMFITVNAKALGSASIAQIHRAVTLNGDQVIIKAVKPGIVELLKIDTILLSLLGDFLELFMSRYQPKRVIQEFCEYTLKEVDLEREADNAEMFAINFKHNPDVVFPKIYREYSGPRVLTMAFFDGLKPSHETAQKLSQVERDKLVDLGAGSIIQMLYGDGFFHADLHPGNLIILPGPRCGFIDLGMVGRFDDHLRRSMLYYYCLVMGDSENAAQYLTNIAQSGAGGRPKEFQRAVADVSRRWKRAATFEDFSLAQLILESVSLGGQFRMYFPVEMILMVKALITFEGVGQILNPGFDVAHFSKKHINRIFFRQFHPQELANEITRNAPQLAEALFKAPYLVTEGLRFLEQKHHVPPTPSLHRPLIAGSCIISGAILLSSSAVWPLWSGFLICGFLISLSRR